MELAWLRQEKLTLANLIANIGIVVTGGAVRLSGSGLACPTWPECVEGSYVPTPAAPSNVAIEFGNRMLTFVLVVIAAATVVKLWRTPHRNLAIAITLGIPGQAVVGGLTVLTDLNPFVVGLHFLLSMAMIAASYVLWQRVAGRPAAVETRLRPMAWALTAASAAVLVIGVLVTGSGPHAGDQKAKRTGFDPEAISQLHVDVVFLVLGLAVALWLTARALRLPGTARAGLVLLGVLLGQGAIGFAQYFTGLPVVLVGLHMAGACAVWVATLHVLHAVGGLPGMRSGEVSTQVTGREMVTV